MELIFQNVWFVPLFPFLASILLGIGLFFFPNSIKKFRRLSSFISIMFLNIAMLLSFHFFWQQITGSPIHRYLWSWVLYKNFVLEIGYLI
ncbi:hypothetical protein Mapa_018901 [Marchantia paleacea]|nr:hypothetical protein Mapa_018901 [Marchantia paleacea]